MGVALMVKARPRDLTFDLRNQTATGVQRLVGLRKNPTILWGAGKDLMPELFAIPRIGGTVNQSGNVTLLARTHGSQVHALRMTLLTSMRDDFPRQPAPSR